MQYPCGVMHWIMIDILISLRKCIKLYELFGRIQLIIFKFRTQHTYSYHSLMQHWYVCDVCVDLYIGTITIVFIKSANLIWMSLGPSLTLLQSIILNFPLTKVSPTQKSILVKWLFWKPIAYSVQGISLLHALLENKSCR